MVAGGEQLLRALKEAAPGLYQQVNGLAERWLSPLVLFPDKYRPAQDKHINDPIWGTITLYPWEVALLDTELVQRLRGVKQLGLAHLVFPTAVHDRFSHACGVVEAVERMMNHIDRNTLARQRSGPPEDTSPIIPERDRYLIRLAALIHDVGHGPFSHAIEPVIGRLFWQELETLTKALRDHIKRTGSVQVSEAIAVLVVASDAFQQVLALPMMDQVRHGRSTADISHPLISAIVGGNDGKAQGALSALVSSQVDADKLDYMARDAYHAGLPIDFDTERLISKLEAVRVDKNTVSHRLSSLGERIDQQGGSYQDIGISAGGTGAFEQMLVGRIFLYDRLYHHHKVRAADSMAQRLVHYADPGGQSLSLATLFASLPDDTVVRAFGGLDINLGTAEQPIKFPSTPASKELSDSIVGRALYKRAFAFAGRFIAGLDTEPEQTDDDVVGWSEAEKDAERQRVMDPVNRQLADVQDRLSSEAEIAELAVEIGSKFPPEHSLHQESLGLKSHHVIVDLPRDPHPPRVTTIARNADSRLDVPDVFFDPARWATVYALQRRTGYVFAHPERRAIICLASRIWFLKRFGCILGEAADRYAKCGSLVHKSAYAVLEEAGVLDSTQREYFERPRLIYVPLDLKPVHVPKEWREADPDFVARFNTEFAKALPRGLSALAERELVQTLRGVFSTMHSWSADKDFVTGTISNEPEFQTLLRRALRQIPLDITEAARVAGGITDLISSRRVLIENKFEKDPTDKPFDLVPHAALQGRRYVMHTGQSFCITAVAYRAKTEIGRLPAHKCVLVRRHSEVDFAEIVVAIRFGDTDPSRAKQPS